MNATAQGSTLAFACEHEVLGQNTQEHTWATLGVALAALPISLYFLVTTWKHWLALHRPTALVASVPPTIPQSSSRRCVNLSGSTSTGEKDVPSVDSSRLRQRSLDTIHSSGSRASSLGSVGGEPSSDWPWRHTTKYWFRKLFQPRTVNQLIGNLLLCSWVILTLDQLFHALFIVSITFVCPHYNCVDYTTFATRECPAGSFEAVQLVIQPFGSCLFIVATINRFVNVYSKLSRGRFLALRAGTVLVFFVCFGLSAVTALTYFVTLSTSSTAEQVAEVQRMLVLGDFITYQTLGIVAVSALVMGLQYIYEIRKEVTALRPSIATASIFNAADTPNGVFSFLAVNGTASLDSPVPSLPDPQSGSPGTSPPSTSAPAEVTSHSIGITMSPSSIPHKRSIVDTPLSAMGPSRSRSAAAVSKAVPKLPSTAAATLQRAYHSDRRKQIMTVVCILVNIAIIISFLFQHPYIAPPTQGAKKPSTLLDLAILSLVQKVFAAVATLAIQLMSDLVLANKKSSMGPR